MSDYQYTLMIVEDEPITLATTVEVLSQKLDHPILSFEDPYKAMQQFFKAPVPLVITDLSMPNIDGFEMIKKMKNRNAITEFIVVTGHQTLTAVVQSRQLGASYIFFKPANMKDLVTAIETMYERHLYWLNQIDAVTRKKES